jgi:hypothetical protein
MIPLGDLMNVTSYPRYSRILGLGHVASATDRIEDRYHSPPFN